MKKSKTIHFLLFAIITACSGPQMENLDPEAIKAVMIRVCDLQLENLKDSVITNEHII